MFKNIVFKLNNPTSQLIETEEFKMLTGEYTAPANIFKLMLVKYISLTSNALKKLTGKRG